MHVYEWFCYLMYTWRSCSRNFKLKSETQGWQLSSRMVSHKLCYDRFRDGGSIPAWSL